MFDRVKDKFDIVPDWWIADTAHGPMLNWLVDREIAPYIPVILYRLAIACHRREGQDRSPRWHLAPIDFEWDALLHATGTAKRDTAAT